jgi:hypothetical protein
MSKPILIDRTEPDLIQTVADAFVAEGFIAEEAVVLAEVATKAMKDDNIKFLRSGRNHVGYQITSAGAT